MGKKFKKLLAMVLSLAILATFCAVPMTASAEDTNLKFGNDGKFKIVIFSDVQDRFPVYQRIVTIMREAIEREQPDLVVFTGDMTEMHTTDPDVDFRRTLNQILAPVVEANVPYAITFGNHDDEGPDSDTRANKEKLLEVYQSIGDCRTYDAAPSISGTSNCKIPIYSSNGNDVAFNLWMLDSNTYYDASNTNSGYGNPMPDQVAWMEANNDAGVNSFVFQHIPMPEIYNLLVEDENGARSYGGKKYALQLNSNASGYLGEYPHPCNAENNTGEFEALKRMGNVLGVFTGHDHLNDFTGTIDGIDMTAVPGMTYLNYGQEAVRAYGVIELNENDLSNYEYHTVKFSTLDEEAGATDTEIKYDVYDEISYSDLKKDGNKLGETFTIGSSGYNFTYDATSPSKSAVLKFRWTAGSNPGYQFSFDVGENGNIANPFGVWIQRADQSGPYGAWLLKPDSLSKVAISSQISKGDTFDIELGRLKIVEGPRQYLGQYYVYLKVDGKLIKDGYSNTNEEGQYISGRTTVCQTSNTIRFGGWGNGGDDVISEYVEPVTEEYAAYDVVEYEDFLDTGNHHLSADGLNVTAKNTLLHYDVTSETHSVIYKFRWVSGTATYFQMFPGEYVSNNPFMYRINVSAAEWYKRYNPGIETKPIGYAINEGDEFDIEIGRLKVVGGANAGKYLSYFKVNGEEIFSVYVTEAEANAVPTSMLDSIQFATNSDGATYTIKASPKTEVEEPEEEPESIYAAYDVVEYEDFLDTGNHHLSADGLNVTAKNTLLHYDVTSETHSVIYKFRWVSGSATYFQMFPGEYVSNNPFMYRINVSDAQWYKRYNPGIETKPIGYAINEGDEFDIEIGRLKVVKGENAGKYHSYFKVNGEEIFSVYVTEAEANAVPTSMLDSIQFATNSDGATYTIKASPKAEVEEPEEPEVPVDPNPDAPYYDYDEITYSDLKKDGNSVSSEGSNINSGNVFTYDATSPTYSAIFKFRWTVGSDTGIQFSFDKSGTNMISYPFGVWVKKPNSDGAGANGAWHLRPTHGNLLVDMNSPATEGKTYDIELARLKVKNGDNAGKYYVYLKVDGELIQETYVEINEDGTYTSGSATCQISNEITFCDWGGYNNFISAIPVPETLDTYDEIGYSDLFVDGNPVGGETQLGSQTFTYNKTSSSHSVVLKYRWMPTAGVESFLSFDTLDEGGWAYKFAVQVVKPSAEHPNGYIDLRPGYVGGEVELPEAIETGKYYDVEFARIKVLTGNNAGKYLVYFKMNDVYVEEYIDAGIDADGKYTSNWNNLPATASNKIYMNNWGGDGGHKITYIPVPETFDTYDEIGYSDLFVDGNPVGGETQLGSHTFTYNKTSSSHSVVFKYRWMPTAGVESFLSFDTLDDGNWAYKFAVQVVKPSAEHPNGYINLRPGYDGGEVELPEAIETGKYYDVEFARIKVLTGNNAGKYLVYFKMNDVYVEEYIDAGIDADGKYTSNWNNLPATASNKIYMNNWGGDGGHKITYIPVPETLDTYDEIGYSDLFVDGNPVGGETQLGSQTFTYNKTSSSHSVVFKYRWMPVTGVESYLAFDVRDDGNGNVHKFGVQIYSANDQYPNGYINLRPGYDGGEVGLSAPIQTGDVYDIEFARIKVLTGNNAGKYLVYFKMNDIYVEEYIDAGIDENGKYTTNWNNLPVTASNKIYISNWGGGGGHKITDIPVPVTYEDYDEIGIEDLMDAEGNSIGSQISMSGATALTYNKTSPTGSVIFKYRWKVGTVPKFQLSFDRFEESSTMSYMFGAQLDVDDRYPNGRMWLRPSYGPEVNLPQILTSGSSHNVEFARLKVKTGSNAGKYYVYIKIDDVLIAESYVDANVVDVNGDYISNTDKAFKLSNEILFTFWGSDGNSILAYRESASNEHEGIKGDLSGDGVINVNDLTGIKKIILGVTDINELPEGIADFNNDGVANILDYIAIIKFIAKSEDDAYAKQGSLTLGMQEHLLEDATKTATYIADASATLGATSYRLSKPIHQLYYVNSSNQVVLREDNMAEFKGMVEALKAQGINEILYVTDSFILPYGYANSVVNHNITVPDSKTDPDNYIAWLTVNAAAFKALAEEVPEIKFFEPFNEINTTGTRLEKYGCPWEASEEVKAAHKFTVQEKAAIMADLCWYVSDAVKSVDSANQVLSPSIVTGSNAVIENDFIDEFYKAIESGNYPTNKAVGDMNVDNYFTIVNIHAYPDYTEDDSWLGDNFESNARKEINEWAGYINAAYDVVKAHRDGDSRVWITETGMSTSHSDGAYRDEQNVADILKMALTKLDAELTFIDTVIFYKIADISFEREASPSETYFGLFYSGDDMFDPYVAKESAKAIYSYFHNGSTDYSALDNLTARYAG